MSSSRLCSTLWPGFDGRIRYRFAPHGWPFFSEPEEDARGYQHCVRKCVPESEHIAANSVGQRNVRRGPRCLRPAPEGPVIVGYGPCLLPPVLNRNNGAEIGRASAGHACMRRLSPVARNDYRRWPARRIPPISKLRVSRPTRRRPLATGATSPRSRIALLSSERLTIRRRQLCPNDAKRTIRVLTIGRASEYQHTGPCRRGPFVCHAGRC